MKKTSYIIWLVPFICNIKELSVCTVLYLPGPAITFSAFLKTIFSRQVLNRLRKVVKEEGKNCLIGQGEHSENAAIKLLMITCLLPIYYISRRLSRLNVKI
jgi:hypothetical protein